MPGYARVCQSMPEYTRVCQSMPVYARVCQSMPEYVVPSFSAILLLKSPIISTLFPRGMSSRVFSNIVRKSSPVRCTYEDLVGARYVNSAVMVSFSVCLMYAATHQCSDLGSIVMRLSHVLRTASTIPPDAWMAFPYFFLASGGIV